AGQRLVGWYPAFLFLGLLPARQQPLEITLQEGVEVMVRVELVDVADAGQIKRHGRPPHSPTNTAASFRYGVPPILKLSVSHRSRCARRFAMFRLRLWSRWCKFRGRRPLWAAR